MEEHEDYAFYCVEMLSSQGYAQTDKNEQVTIVFGQWFFDLFSGERAGWIQSYKGND